MTTKLVCTVGIGNYYQTNYRFGEVSKKTKFAPIAVGCCAIGPTEDLELVALLTVEAEEEYGEQLEIETEAQGWTYTPVRIPAGRCEEELWQIFDAFGQRLEQGDGLVLDLTHGFRHIPALLLSATQYYVVRKNLKLFGIFYGAYVNGEKDTSILDLTALHDLSKWTYGARLMEDYRLSTPLGEMLDEIQTRSHKDPRYQHSRFTKLQRVGKSLKDLESPLVSGIPLETGFEARRALENVRSGKEEIERIPPMKEPWRELEEELERVKLQNPGHKKDVLLTLEELKRQSLLIAGYLRSGNLTAAANLLREWMVSAVIFHSGDTENWLDYGKRRKPVEMRLGALSEWNKPGSFKEALTAEQKQVLALWKKVSERRNAFAHAGMSENMTKFDPDTLREPFEELKIKLEYQGFWSVETAGKTKDKWLISPLGTTPGALFTAIKRAEPDQLLVVTSEQGKELVPEVLQKAGRENLTPYFAVLDDPFNGFSEVREKRLTKSLRREHGLGWIRAKDIVVNLTGGTTCLGWTVGQLENSIKGMSLKPRTVACIDRRTPEEQKRDPYREGEMQDIHLDEDEEKGNE